MKIAAKTPAKSSASRLTTRRRAAPSPAAAGRTAPAAACGGRRSAAAPTGARTGVRVLLGEAGCFRHGRSPCRQRGSLSRVAAFLAASSRCTPARAATGAQERAGAGERLDAGLLDRPPQAVAQLDRRLPAEDLARERDVRLADLRVVGRAAPRRRSPSASRSPRSPPWRARAA